MSDSIPRIEMVYEEMSNSSQYCVRFTTPAIKLGEILKYWDYSTDDFACDVYFGESDTTLSVCGGEITLSLRNNSTSPWFLVESYEALQWVRDVVQALNQRIREAWVARQEPEDDILYKDRVCAEVSRKQHILFREIACPNCGARFDLAKADQIDQFPATCGELVVCPSCAADLVAVDVAHFEAFEINVPRTEPGAPGWSLKGSFSRWGALHRIMFESLR